jgi:hypothetical protein
VEVLNSRRVRVLEFVVKEPDTKEFSHRTRAINIDGQKKKSKEVTGELWFPGLTLKTHVFSR